MSPFEPTRRAVRAKVRCVARVATREGGYWLTHTRDFSSHGCQLEAPCEVEPGTRVFLELLDACAEPRLAVAGHVAWCAAAPPWCVGVAFDDLSFLEAARFFERLAARAPEPTAESPPSTEEPTGRWRPVLARFS